VKKIATDLGDNTRLLIRVLDWNRSTPPELIGEFQLTLGELKDSDGQRFGLVDSKKKEKNGSSYTNSGILHFASVIVHHMLTLPAFLLLNVLYVNQL
jgi:hypothetical protein